MKKSTGQIIYYSESETKCFDVESYEDITELPEMVEITDGNDCIRRYIPSRLNPTTIIISGEEIVSLDSTTMKRIAKFNLEKENEFLLKEINDKKKEIAELQEQEKEMRNRFEKAIDKFHEIMETVLTKKKFKKSLFFGK